MKRLDREFLAQLLAIASLHPFGKGDITSDGVQWSTEVTTSDGTFTEVESAIIEYGTSANIKEIGLALTLQIKSSGAAKFVKFKWQARNKGGTWVDLHVEVTYAANASVYAEYTYTGRFKTVANFNKVPFEIRAVIQREDATENAIAQLKNSSCIILIIDPRTEVER